MVTQESFKNPQEEIQWLEKKLEEKKREVEETQEEFKPQETAKEVIKEYSLKPSPIVPVSPPRDTQNAISKLQNEPHAKQVEELLHITKKRGILEAVTVARHLNNPHLLDDFHDRLALELLKGTQ